jgi:hypothetical protein
MRPIGRLQEVPIREVWEHARDFTTWLAADGLEHLADQLGLVIADATPEQSEGDRYADIVGYRLRRPHGGHRKPARTDRSWPPRAAVA